MGQLQESCTVPPPHQQTKTKTYDLDPNTSLFYCKIINYTYESFFQKKFFGPNRVGWGWGGGLNFFSWILRVKYWRYRFHKMTKVVELANRYPKSTFKFL